MIKGMCRVCDRPMHAPSLDALICGNACRELKTRREAHSQVQPGHPEYHPITPEQERMHRMLRPMFTRRKPKHDS